MGWLLTLDRGNSTLDGFWHIEPPSRRRVDPNAERSVAALLDGHDLDEVVALTVVPGGLDPVERHLADLGVPCRLAGRDLPCPLALRYGEPETLGVDRWVGALAAHRRYGDAVVIDCGTAVTFNAVSAAGEFLGGAIAPGAETMAIGLSTAAPALPLATLQEPPRVPANDSMASVSAGVQFGFAGAVERLCAELCAAVELENPTLVVTGGLAPLLLRLTELPLKHHDDLIHQGLRWLSETADSNC